MLGTPRRAPPETHRPRVDRVRRGDGDDDAKPRPGSRARAARRKRGIRRVHPRHGAFFGCRGRSKRSRTQAARARSAPRVPQARVRVGAEAQARRRRFEEALPRRGDQLSRALRRTRRCWRVFPALAAAHVAARRREDGAVRRGQVSQARVARGRVRQGQVPGRSAVRGNRANHRKD